MEKYLVTPEDGRVERDLGDGRSVLVGLPGDEIDMALAKELGLVKSRPAKTKTAESKAPVAKATESKKTEADAGDDKPRLSSYPTKKSSG